MESVKITDSYNVVANDNLVAQIINKISELLYEFRRDKQAQRVVAIVFSINLFFILLHLIVQVMGQADLLGELYFKLNLDSGGLRVHHDGSIPELFNYLQTTICVGLLLGVFRATRQPVYGAWALIFLFVVLDDSLKIHEKVASDIIATFVLPALPGLRPKDSAEMLVWAMSGSVLLGILWWGFAWSQRGARTAGAVLALNFSVLVFFAIGIDMIHVAFSNTSAVAFVLLPILEDGGEMLSIGLACALALLLYRHPAIAG
jgi:hypothetical protein